MRMLVWGLVLALIVLHQDLWFWDTSTLVFGFMPITLLYHAGISLAAGMTWYLATKYAWPFDDGQAAPSQDEEGGDAA